MQLPEEFVTYTREMMGTALFQRYLDAFNQEPPVSIRLNPLKTQGLTVAGGERVPWCEEGYYLPTRPAFTMDPLLHAGCYYVQEAASMFVSHVLRQYVAGRPVAALDLCAAPGGKSTAAIAALPPGSTLHSNEPVRNRASVLLENITKWGYPGCTVTNSYPKDYRRARLHFDIILCDVPCSGEGMFRRDPATIGEWSQQQVEKCRLLQRDIVADAWACLNPGGLLVYSTCTFNTRENEENVLWMLQQFGDAEVLPVATRPEWHIAGSLLPALEGPVYRFIPGLTRSEGLFLCVLRKKGASLGEGCQVKGASLGEGCQVKGEGRNAGRHSSPLTILPSPFTLHPSPKSPSPENVTYAQAISYLRGEALTLPPDTPRGLVTISFMGHPLGQAKNIGTRANNLYPKEWRIRTTHTPQDYQPVLID